MKRTEFMHRFSTALFDARTKRRMTVLQMADAIGISESAYRRIENGTSGNCRGETLLAALVWAGRHGYREFAGFTIEDKRPDTPETVAEKVETALEFGRRFEALGRTEMQ